MKQIRPVTPDDGTFTLATLANTVISIINLGNYVTPSFLPDEVEDYLSVKIKKAVIIIDVFASSLASILAQSRRDCVYGVPVIIKTLTSSDHPTKADDAWSETVGAIEEYVNSKFADDIHRTIELRQGKMFNSQTEVYWDSQANNAKYNHYVSQRYFLDVTKIIQDSIKKAREAGHSAELADVWVCLYMSHAVGDTMTGLSHAFMIVDYDYQQVKNVPVA